MADKQEKKVILDTDIGSDIDDAVALAYLLKHPQCHLMGITTVSGQPVERAKLASALCIAAGKPDIPIYPGTESPILAAAKAARSHSGAGSCQLEACVQLPERGGSGIPSQNDPSESR